MGRPINKKYFGNTTSSGTGGYTITAITVDNVGRYQPSSPPTIVAPPTLPNGRAVTADVYTRVKNTSYTTILQGGTGYQYNDLITVQGGNTSFVGGAAAQFTVKSTQLNNLVIVNGGHGYAVSDQLTITNTSGVDSVIQVEEIDNGDSPRSLSGASITGTGGQFAVSDPTPTGVPDFYVGQLITISGTGAGDDGSITGYANPTTYKIKTVVSQTSLVLETLVGGALTTIAGPLANYTLAWTPGVITDVSVLTPGSRVSANPAGGTAPDSDNNTRATGATFNMGWGIRSLDTNPTTRGKYKTMPTDTYAVFNIGSGSEVVVNYEVASVVVTNATGANKNHGYAEELDANVTFSAGLDRATNDGVTYVLSTTGRPVILARAYTGGTRKDVDIVKQRSSRRYQVDANDQTDAFVAKLVGKNSASNADFIEMDITAFDSGNNEYWVTKLTARLATLVRKNSNNGQFATGALVKWNLTGAVEDESVMLENN